MRKVTGGLLATALVSSLVAPLALADGAPAGLPILVDGKAVTSDVPAFMDSAHWRVMAPVRFVAEALGAQVQWDGDHRAVLINTPVYPAGSPAHDGVAVFVGGKALTTDVPATLSNNRVFVPVRFVAEALQASVAWNQNTGSVQISSATALGITGGALSMRSALVDLQQALDAGDGGRARAGATALETAWAKFEDDVRARDKALYGKIEEPLGAIQGGVKADQLDAKVIGDQVRVLDGLLVQLASADSVKTGALSMRWVLIDLQRALTAGDIARVQQAATALEDAWSKFEDDVHAHDKVLYGKIEEPLDGIRGGVKADKLDAKLIGEQARLLDSLLTQLGQ